MTALPRILLATRGGKLAAVLLPLIAYRLLQLPAEGRALAAWPAWMRDFREEPPDAPPVRGGRDRAIVRMMIALDVLRGSDCRDGCIARELDDFRRGGGGAENVSDPLRAWLSANDSALDALAADVRDTKRLTSSVPLARWACTTRLVDVFRARARWDLAAGRNDRAMEDIQAMRSVSSWMRQVGWASGAATVEAWASRLTCDEGCPASLDDMRPIVLPMHVVEDIEARAHETWVYGRATSSIKTFDDLVRQPLRRRDAALRLAEWCAEMRGIVTSSPADWPMGRSHDDLGWARVRWDLPARRELTERVIALKAARDAGVLEFRGSVACACVPSWRIEHEVVPSGRLSVRVVANRPWAREDIAWLEPAR